MRDLELEPPDRLADELDRLDRAWDDVEPEPDRVTLDADEYEAHLAACDDDRTFMYAGALVVRDDELLLVHPEDGDGWTEPGGAHEAGETVEETARRETREETGLTVELTGVWRTLVLRLTNDDRPPVWSLGVTFEATPVGGELRPEPGEIADVDWFETLPDDLLYEGFEVPETFR